MAYIFLEDGDLESAILAQFLNERSEEPQLEILEIIEKKKVALIKTKLNRRFDLTAIFTAAGDDRNFYILDILIKLVLYDFISRNAARKMPKDVKDDRDEALKTLEAIKAGKEVPDGLPSITDTDGNTVAKVISGNNRNENYYI
jgi:hypothetical protein